MVRRTEDQQATDNEALANDALKSGWQATIQDMRAMAADREEQGYETFTLVSGDTSPVPSSAPEADYWGFTYLIQSDQEEDFEDFYLDGEFEDTGVYQQVDAGHVFMVEENIDFDNERVIYIAGTYMMMDAPALVKEAMDRGMLYSHVRTLDQTILGTFDHDDPSAYFPDPDSYYELQPDF